MNFSQLSQTIQFTHLQLQAETVKAINLHLTIRNWLIGWYIVEFEQKGEDRAQYGTKLISKLGEQLNHKSLSAGNLKVFRQFYLAYWHLGSSIKEQPAAIGLISQSAIGQLLETATPIGQSPIVQFQSIENQLVNNAELSGQAQPNQWLVPADLLLKRLSYTHLV